MVLDLKSWSVNGSALLFMDIFTFAKKTCPFMRREEMKAQFSQPKKPSLFSFERIDIYEERKPISKRTY